MRQRGARVAHNVGKIRDAKLVVKRNPKEDIKENIEEGVRRTRKAAKKTYHSVRGAVPSVPVLWSYLRQTVKEVRKRKINFCLGCCSCFIVVVVVAFMMSLLTNSPVVFLHLAELNAGEIDLEMIAGDWTGYSQVNYTLAAQTLFQNEDWSYHSPRHVGDTALFPERFCSIEGTNLDPYDQDLFLQLSKIFLETMLYRRRDGENDMTNPHFGKEFVPLECNSLGSSRSNPLQSFLNQFPQHLILPNAKIQLANWLIMTS
eukprot:TRINITY_DN18448_c0_g1_i1.p2 TRINITY_DN18448_c0_g1~~TRINITY_DN18448_c0_g1_i1.p2  ORF type:complete len:259 (-),score=24.17 TRINITY_DN18448_c0_g1_i1:289-1065(-)